MPVLYMNSEATNLRPITGSRRQAPRPKAPKAKTGGILQQSKFRPQSRSPMHSEASSSTPASAQIPKYGGPRKNLNSGLAVFYYGYIGAFV